MLLHPNTLFVQTHFRVSKLYIIWSSNIPWLVIRKCVFWNIAKNDIVFCWVPSHTGIKCNGKADTAAKSALDLPRGKVSVPNSDFKHLISQYIFSTWQGDWNGEVMKSFILSSQSWEIGSPPTGGAGRTKLSCVVPSSVIHIWPIHIVWGKILHLCVRTVRIFWQFATFWWSAISLLEKGKIYLVEEMWWNHLDSTPH